MSVAVSLPSSHESEMASLGAMLVDKDAVASGVDQLETVDFYENRNGFIFEAISEVNAQDKPIDIVTVTEQLQTKKKLSAVGGVEFLTSLAESVPTTANANFYIKTVKEKSQLRKLIDTGKKLQELGFNSESTQEAIDSAESMVFKLSRSSTADRIVRVADQLEDYKSMLRDRVKNPNRITGLETGLRDIDMITGGLQRSDLIISAGRPSMGKTALALNIAQNVSKQNKTERDVDGAIKELKQGKKVVVFSLEMSTEQLIERMVCVEANISAEKMRAGQLDSDEWKKVGKALEEIGSWNLEIDDSPSITVGEIRSKLRKSHTEMPIDLVVIDYLGLISDGNTKAANKSDIVGEKTRALKQSARELDCPIILLSQLNRGVEQREDKRPMMSDLRDSGAIEQDADVIMMLYRDEYYNSDSPAKNIAEVIFTKQRKGSTGTVELAFMKQYTKFLNLERVRDSR